MKLKKLNFIAYVGLFMILLLASFFRIYNSSIFKIMVPLIIGLSCVHYFLKGDKTNFFKLGILVLFLGHNANQYFYIILTIALFNTKVLLAPKGPIKYIYLLLLFGLLSFIINQFIELNFLSLPFFVASFFLPIGIFAVAYRYSSVGLKDELVAFYLNVVLILAIVAIIQNLLTGATVDQLTGGTTSAHTLGFHMAVAFLYTSAKVLRSGFRNSKLTEIFLLILTVPVMYLSDAKYLFLNALASLTFIFLLFHTQKIIKPVIFCALVVFSYLSIDFLKTAKISVSPKISFTYMDIVEKLTFSAKYQLAENTLKLPKNEPMIFIFGSGPGTFLSRASNSRAFDTMEKKSAIGGGEAVAVESKLPSFIPPHTSWVTHRYATQFFQKRWFGTLFDYRSSLISFVWEFGIIGTLLLIIFFLNLIKRANLARKRSLFSKSEVLFIQSFIIFYLLNSILAYYFEYPETQILLWMLLGVFSSNNLMNNNQK